MPVVIITNMSEEVPVNPEKSFSLDVRENIREIRKEVLKSLSRPDP